MACGDTRTDNVVCPFPSSLAIEQAINRWTIALGRESPEPSPADDEFDADVGNVLRPEGKVTRVDPDSARMLLAAARRPAGRRN
jgi:hypothetical protein